MKTINIKDKNLISPVLDIINESIYLLDDSIIDFIVDFVINPKLGKLDKDHRFASPIILASLLGRLFDDDLQAAIDEIFNGEGFLKWNNLDKFNKLSSIIGPNSKEPITIVMYALYRALIKNDGSEIPLSSGSCIFTREYPKINKDFSIADYKSLGNDYMDNQKYIVNGAKKNLQLLIDRKKASDCYVAVCDEVNGAYYSTPHFAFPSDSQTASGKYIVFECDQITVTHDHPIVYTPIKNIDFVMGNDAVARTILPKNIVEKYNLPIIECNF